LTEAERSRLFANEPLAFSHSLTARLGGQMDAGFVLTALYEDPAPDYVISNYMPAYLATRGVKPAAS
jgi:hypothetical protein